MQEIDCGIHQRGAVCFFPNGWCTVGIPAQEEHKICCTSYKIFRDLHFTVGGVVFAIGAEQLISILTSVKYIGPLQNSIVLKTIPVLSRLVDFYRAFEGIERDQLLLTGLVISIRDRVEIQIVLLVT